MRPALERLRDLIAQGGVEAVLAYSPDRLSRKYAYQILLLEEFGNAPAGNGPENELLLQFQGMIAEYEKAQIIERTRRGKLHRARQESVNVLSGAPYGYRYRRRTEEAPASYEVIPEQAEVVRQIYLWYTQEGLSIGWIFKKLTEQGIPTRTGKRRWDTSRRPETNGESSQQEGVPMTDQEKKYWDEKLADIKTHNAVLGEHILSNVKLVAEQYSNVAERLSGVEASQEQIIEALRGIRIELMAKHDNLAGTVEDHETRLTALEVKAQ